MRLKTPQTVKMMGWLTILTSVGYFFCVFLAYRPGLKTFSDHFIKYTILYVYPPVMCLALYMYMRANVGKWLLAEGRLDDALAYSLPRIWPDFWLRSVRESLIHRTIALKVYLRQGQYEQAKALIEPEDKRIEFKNKEGIVFLRWATELGLRADDLLLARKQHEPLKALVSDKIERASALAALADVETRSRQKQKAQQLLDEAQWSDEDNERLKLSRALFMEIFEPEEAQTTLTLLESIPETYFETIPGQHAEWLLAQYHAHLRLDTDADAIKELQDRIMTAYEQCDPRAALMIEQAFELSPKPLSAPDAS